jgi:small subunit ribosomal protein S8
MCQAWLRQVGKYLKVSLRLVKMSMSDPVSDMLTRIRNAQAVAKKKVQMPSSKLKVAIAHVLKDEGYVDNYEVLAEGNKQVLSIGLRYYNNKPVIERLERVSTPGLRVYVGKNHLPKVMSGLGIAIISTSNGVVSDRAARKQGQGGEVLCYVS